MKLWPPRLRYNQYGSDRTSKDLRQIRLRQRALQSALKIAEKEKTKDVRFANSNESVLGSYSRALSDGTRETEYPGARETQLQRNVEAKSGQERLRASTRAGEPDVHD